MIVIDIDPHKSTHTATALDPATNSDVGSLRIEASITEYQRLIVWAKAWPDRAWAIENADGLGHHLALWLLALGEVVLDIPTTATARVRELSRGGRRTEKMVSCPKSVIAPTAAAGPFSLAKLISTLTNVWATVSRTASARSGAGRVLVLRSTVMAAPRIGHLWGRLPCAASQGGYVHRAFCYHFRDYSAFDRI